MRGTLSRYVCTILSQTVVTACLKAPTGLLFVDQLPFIVQKENVTLDYSCIVRGRLIPNRPPSIVSEMRVSRKLM